MSHLTDTIIAPATPQGHSAIAVIRLSGPEAVTITDAIFKGADLQKVPSHTVHYGWITGENGSDIDEVMVSVFRAPKTFTAEDSTEISCHGSPHIVQQIMARAISKGARTAHPGEFTLRAFLNGGIDLSQPRQLLTSYSPTRHGRAKSRSNNSKVVFQACSKT